MISFEVYGKLRGKGRPRFRRVGNFVSTYSDSETVSYENYIKLMYKETNTEKFMNEEPLKVEIEIYQGLPKSMSNKKKDQALNNKLYPTKKPDVDNIVKSVFDALNGLAYRDDTQIVSLNVSKQYAEDSYLKVKIDSISNGGEL